MNMINICKNDDERKLRNVTDLITWWQDVAIYSRIAVQVAI